MRIRIRRSMSFAIIACIVLVLAVAASSTASDRTTKIVGGSVVGAPAFTGKWTSTVALVDAGVDDARDAQFCGGTLIDTDLVITAAHCVTNFGEFFPNIIDPEEVQVIGGRRTLSSTDGSKVDVTMIAVNKAFDPETLRNDVALLHLSAQPTGALPLALVGAGETAFWGAGAGLASDLTNGPWVAGWGERASQTTYTSALPDTLNQAVVPILADDVCVNGGIGANDGFGYGRFFDPTTMLCAGTLDSSDLNDFNVQNNGVDSCYGDSGGPLIVWDTVSAWRLAGIVSWGFGCATRLTHGVYTRVDSQRAWVESDPVEPVRLVEGPTLKGAPVVGATLTCDNGEWSGAEPITYTYRWLRTNDEDVSMFEEGFSIPTASNPNPQPRAKPNYIPAGHSLPEYWYADVIDGATSSTYMTVLDDVDHAVFCEVTAENSSWKQVAISNQTDSIYKESSPPYLELRGRSCSTAPCRFTLAAVQPDGGTITAITATYRYSKIKKAKRRLVRVVGIACVAGVEPLWNCSFPKRKGRFVINARATDEFGNRSNRVTFVWNV